MPLPIPLLLYLTQVNSETLAMHLWPPAPLPDVPEPPPLPHRLPTYRSQWLINTNGSTAPGAAGADGIQQQRLQGAAAPSAGSGSAAAGAAGAVPPVEALGAAAALAAVGTGTGRQDYRERLSGGSKKPYVMLSPSVLRYIEDRRVVLEKGRKTVKLFNWPRGHLAEYGDDCEVLLQVKVPAKTGRAAAPEPAPELAAEPAAAAVGEGVGKDADKGGTGAAGAGAAAAGGGDGLASSSGDKQAAEPAGEMSPAAGVAGGAAEAAGASMSPAEADGALSLLAAAAAEDTESDADEHSGGDAGGGTGGAWNVPMVVVEEARVLLRTYQHVGAHRSACQLIRLLRLLDDFVGWRVICLEKVELGLCGGRG